MSSKRVLFVDDQSSILDGIRNLLRKQRKHWDMAFASGPEAALAEMAKGPFDVVVTDMRMPGIDGAALLTRVKEQYPGAVRIVLSGHAEREAVMRVLPVAHQFLSKPCDAEVLRSTIERAFELQSVIAESTIRELVGRIDKLPSPPAIYCDLTRAAGDPDVGLTDIALTVEKDPAMSAKVLQLANSSYFGLSNKISSVQQAVTHLGGEALRALALSAQVFGTVKVVPLEGFSLEDVQDRSLRVAHLAKRFAKSGKQSEEVFAAAIIQDIGRIVLALGAPERYGTVIQAARESRRPIHIVEQEQLTFTHAEVSAYLLGVWGLPLPIVETAALHHTPSRMTQGSQETLAVLHAADALVEPAGDEPGEDRIDLAFLERAGVIAELPRWRALAAEAT